MNAKATIRKILFILFWICIGGGMLTLLIAAIGRKNKELCRDSIISIKNSKGKLFIDEKDISRLLKAAIGEDFKGKKITGIDLSRLEKLLQENIWVRDAEMWFDNRNVLHIEVWEREPVARIFTTSGNTFYIDSSTRKIPLSDKMIASLPVFTGFPEKRIYKGKDSMLMQDVKKMALFLSADPFWQSQVQQVNITDDRKFELIPLVGNHVISFGNGQDMEKKFNRLMIFYKQVLSQSGFDIYKMVDVQYAGQIIGTKRGDEKNSVDTVQLKKNIEQLLRKVQQQNDNLAILKPTIEKPAIESGSNSVSTINPEISISGSTNPNTVKTKSLPMKNESKPKAVMTKKSQ